MEALKEKANSFLSTMKQMEEWAAMLSDPKAAKQYKEGKNFLKEASADLGAMIQMIDLIPDLESSNEPEGKASDKPLGQSSEKPLDKLLNNVTDKMSEKPSEKLPEGAVAKPSEKQLGQLSEKPLGQPSEKPLGQPSEKPLDKLLNNVTDKMSEKPSEKLPNEAPAKPSDKPSDKPLGYTFGLPFRGPYHVPLRASIYSPLFVPHAHPFYKWVPTPHPPLVVIFPEYAVATPYPITVVPIFYGNSRYWPVFKESFENHIHLNPAITISDKVLYLVGYLFGEAQSLIANISPVEENYDLIWTTLLQKYENPQEPYVRYSFTPRNRTQESHIESFYYFQEVLNYCFVVYNCLCRMNYAVLGHTVIYEIVQAAIEPDLLYQLTRSMNEDQIPTFPQTSGFLQYQIQRMDRLSNDMEKKIVNNKGRVDGLVTTFPANKICTFCKESTHKLFNCKGFLELTPINKYAYVKKNQRCFNCLGRRHTVTTCLSQNVCSFCKKKHHSLLHDEDLPPHEHHFVVVPSETGYKLKAFSCPTEPKPESVILGTAALKAFEGNGRSATETRALLDSASQCHLITKECREKLNLPLLPLDTFLTGVADFEKVLLGKTVIKFAPHFNPNHVFSIFAYVLENICFELPTVKISPSIKEKMIRFKLADPNFDIPSPIDILIGSEIFPMLLKKKQYRVPESFCYGIETIFGWIIMGRAPVDGSVHSKQQILCCVNAIRNTLRRLQDINQSFHQDQVPGLTKGVEIEEVENDEEKDGGKNKKKDDKGKKKGGKKDSENDKEKEENKDQEKILEKNQKKDEEKDKKKDDEKVEKKTQKKDEEKEKEEGKKDEVKIEKKVEANGKKEEKKKPKKDEVKIGKKFEAKGKKEEKKKPKKNGKNTKKMNKAMGEKKGKQKGQEKKQKKNKNKNEKK